ncbi:MAG: T9SS type A sorting domain-containing protein [Vicingus serpentipes]|nr:T9SS type A sorting domain-containing protein [Vicingus serpentipes]
MTKRLQLFLLLLFPVTLLSQVNISNTTLITCGETIYDDGGPSGDYTDGNSYVMTLCSNNGGTLYGVVNSFALGMDPFSNTDERIIIYDGNTTFGTVLFDSDTNFSGVVLISSGTCLTIEFQSVKSVLCSSGCPGSGFEFEVSCTLPETCNDGILNNGEVKIDCGGPNCNPCYDFTACASEVVANGGFEGVTSACGTGTTSSGNAVLYTDSTSVADWYGTIESSVTVGGTPDYNNDNCSGNPTQSCLNGFGSLGFYTSNGAGIAGGREYIQSALKNTLEAGEEYCLSVLVSKGIGKGSDGIGFWFHNKGIINTDSSNGGSYFLGPGSIINGQPQVENPRGNIFNACRELKLGFCANGTETHLTIGNFRDNANTSPSGISYLIIDDLSVKKSCPLDFDCGILDSGTPDCVGSCFTLTATPSNQKGGCEVTNDFTYLWSTGDTTAAINVCPTQRTTYSVDVTYSAGCKTLTKTYEYTTCGLSVSIEDQSICLGDSVSLSVIASGGVLNYAFDWSGGGVTGNTGNGTTEPSTNIQTDTPISTTTYTVIVTDGNGDKDTAMVDAIVNQPSLITAKKDTVICIGDTVEISASGIVDHFDWDNGLPDGDGPHTVSPNITTIYTVVGTNFYGCKDTSDVTITVNQGPTLNMTKDTTICIGDTTDIFCGPIGNGPFTFFWDNGLPSSIGPHGVFPSDTTTYHVTVTDANGCMGIDSVKVMVDMGTCVSVGVNKLKKQTTVALYPNPNTGIFTLSIENTQSKTAEITIFDVTGKTILEKSINLPSGKQEIPLDLTSYATQGLYFLNVKTAEGNYRKKIIIQ